MAEQLLNQAAQLPAEEALPLLQSHAEKYADHVAFLTQFAELLLEMGEVETGYQVLVRACELDPEANDGAEKFFSLGQIAGGEDGIAFLNTGLQKLQQQVEAGADEMVKAKMMAAIFALVEIWLTDLAEQSDAMEKCHQLLEYAHKVDPSLGEAWLLTAQVYIMENKFEEAEKAVETAWTHMLARRDAIVAAGSQDPFDYVELIQPMAALIKAGLEVGSFDLVTTMCQTVADIDDNILEIFYYEALAYLMATKLKLLLDLDAETEEVVAKAQEAGDDEITAALNDARLALTQGYRVINLSDDVDPEVADQVQQMLTAMGGPNMKELMPQKDADVDVDGWEDELEEAE